MNNQGKSDIELLEGMLQDFIMDSDLDMVMGHTVEPHNLLYYTGRTDDSSLDAVFMDYLKDTVFPHKVAVADAGHAFLAHKNLFKYLEVDSETFREQLLFHDMSKFSAEEAAYATHDFGGINSPEQTLAFRKAWHHHKQYNEHHPEHWFSVGRSGEVEQCFQMPAHFVLEMVADWIGAGVTYENTLEDWLPENLHTFVFHTETVGILKDILYAIGIRDVEQSTHLSIPHACFLQMSKQ